MVKEIAKIKYGFVILHYIAYEMTSKCVLNLLRRFAEYDIHIVLVDNASPNGSGRKLLDDFSQNNRVTVLLNKENAGFARGNNWGYRYLIEHIQPDYAIVMNNDVLIEQENFLDIVEMIYRRTSYAVLGPDIFCPATQKHQNPAHIKGFTTDEIDGLYRTIVAYYKHPAFYYYKHATLGKIKRKLVKETNDDSIDRTTEIFNVVLHGACYIFSREFMQYRPECFYSGTFLYMEEDILHYECNQLGLKIIYSPEVHVLHLEDVSTNASIKNEYEKFKMKNREMKHSIEMWKRLMEHRE